MTNDAPTTPPTGSAPLLGQEGMAELIKRRAAALKAADEARAMGLHDVELRHWQEVVRCCLIEAGEPIPASLMPGEPEPKP